MSVIRKPHRNPKSGATDADILAFAAGLVAMGRSPTGEAVALEFDMAVASAHYRIRQMRLRGTWPYPPCVGRPNTRRRP